MKTNFFITYHHSDELAARWIAAVLKEVPFSMLMESWDFLPGQKLIEKIEHMTTFSRCSLVLLSDRFLHAGGDALAWQLVTEKLDSKAVVLLRIDSCDVEKVLGAVTYTNLFGMKEAEARKQLLSAVGFPTIDKRKTELLPETVKTADEVLEKRKSELAELLKDTIKHNYHMKLELELEVEKEVEVKNEKTGKKEKRKQLVWETVALETVLGDRKNYILVNPSGMGKTTFLTHVAHVLLDSAGDGDYIFVPLFFTCISLNNREGSITNFISQQVELFYNNSQTTVVLGEWENLCVLLDALDQARDVDDIVSSLQIHDKYHYYEKAKLIISSRENTAGKVEEGFSKIRLKLPEENEVRQYLGEENYKKLGGHIAASRELVTVPVLLEMLKTITEKGYDASKLWSRADLYNEFTRILIDQERSKPRFWQDPLSIHHFIDYELEQALEKIAFFSLAENRILEIEKDKLVQYCETPDKKEALLNIGIILELFEDRELKIVFRHQSFQAYFAARYMYFRHPELFEKLTVDIGFFYHDVWFEVMRFFMGLEQDPQKVEKIIDSIFKKENGKNIYKKTVRMDKGKFKLYDFTEVQRLIFAISMTSETRVNIKEAQNLYEQLRDLLTNTRQHLKFIISNSDKFNPKNAELRRYSFNIFETLLRDRSWYISHDAAKAFTNIVTARDIHLLEPLLRDDDLHVRTTAVNILGEIGTAKDILLMEPLLRDESQPIRHTVAEALGKIGTSHSISLLEALLWDEDRSVRQAAVEALGKIGTTRDIPLLEKLIRDEDSWVRHAAVEAFGKVGTANDIPLLKPLLRDEGNDAHQAAVEALGNIVTENDITLLEPLLRERSWAVRNAAAKALGGIVTANDIPLLKTLLQDRDREVRCAAVEALGNIVTENDITLLEALLKDKNEYVRCAAVEVFGKIGTNADIALLEPLFQDEYREVRCVAVEVFGKIATNADIALLEPLLQDEDREVRCAVVKELENLITAIDIHLLEPMLSDKNYWVRHHIAKALGKIGTSKQISLLEPLIRDENMHVRRAATKALGEIGTSQQISLLEPLIRDEYKGVRRTATDVLGKIGTNADIALLEPLLQDEDREVRCAAAKVFGKIGTSEQISLLEPLIRDEDTYIRFAATEVFGLIGTSEQISLLEPLLKDKFEYVRHAAAKVLENIITAGDIPILKPLLIDENMHVRRAAAKAFGKILTINDISLLDPLLKDKDEYVRRAATNALGKVVTAKDILLLGPLLMDKEKYVCKAAVEALGNIVTEKDITFMEPLLKDKNNTVRRGTVAILGNIGTAGDIHLVEPLLRDKDMHVRLAAAKAIEQIYRRHTPELCIDDVIMKSKRKEALSPKTIPTQALHILHISDIHYALEKDPAITHIFHEFLEDIKKWKDERIGEKIHAICLTGDIAQSGQKNQYESINEKINAILTITGCSKDNLFIIPGNHDVREYDKISDKGKFTLEQICANKKNIDSHVLCNPDNYLEFHEKFSHYYSFVETAGYLNSLTEKRNGIPKPWYSRKLQDFPVRIIGLNSALFCLKEFSEYGKINMGIHQLNEAYFQGKPGDREKNKPIILLTHHPIEWFEENEKNELKTLIDRYSLIHLHGHVHRLSIDEVRSYSGSTYFLIGTGSIYGEKGTKDVNTYHIMTLDFQNEEIRIWGRRWVPEYGRWTTFMDNSRNTFPFPGKHH